MEMFWFMTLWLPEDIHFKSHVYLKIYFIQELIYL